MTKKNSNYISANQKDNKYEKNKNSKNNKTK